jgi:cytochrome c biogenesis protein CcmG/thiol:disulfide interchange protein DsbE
MSESTSVPPRRVAPFVAGAVAVVLAVLFGVLLVVEPSSDTAETVLLDRAAPAVVGEFDDGTAFELSRRRGSWVVLNFFTSTCIPCRNEHPELIEFVDQQRSLGINGAEFYTIVQNDDPADVAAFFDEFGGDWPVVFDVDYSFQNGFGVAQVPETWIIDPNGIVRGRVISEVSAEFLSTSIQNLRERL